MSSRNSESEGLAPLWKPVILIGIQGSGKSTFYQDRFFDTHVRINLDMLKTRHREKLFLDACLAAKQRFVVDNCNPAREDRRRYIEPAKAAGFKVIGYYLQSKVDDCKERNEKRAGKQVVPLKAILGSRWPVGIAELGGRIRQAVLRQGRWQRRIRGRGVEG